MFTHKWSSNFSEVLKEILHQDRAKELEFDRNISVTAKTLDVLWMAFENIFTLNFNIYS